MSGPILVYGGSFDPVHTAHEAMVQAAIEQLHPQKTLIVPCHVPPHKGSLMASNAQRLAMLSLVFNAYPNLLIDERELRSDSPSYTVNTVTALRQEFGPNASICFLIGGDSWRNFATWFRWQEILKVVNIVVASRPGQALENAELLAYQSAHSASVAEVGKTTSGAITHLEFDERDIASKEIRQALTKGGNIASLTHWLNDSVKQYILEHGLYRVD